MSLIILKKPDFQDFVSQLMNRYRVVGPVSNNGVVAFGEVENPAELKMDYATTVLPPKKYVLPPKEVLFQFSRENGGATETAPDSPPTVILGVHTCDLHAFQLLDSVFSSGQYDKHYMNRRKNTLIVSIECLTPCDEHSFCKSMGTLTADEGYDLHLTDLWDSYAIDIGTEAGKALIDKFPHAKEASKENVQKLNSVITEKWPKFPYRLDFDVSDLSSIMGLSMKSPLWEELGERCLACAMCTNVCPTCFCFDVKDEIELDLVHGQRVRVWDSCQLNEFSTVSGADGDHNFRPSRSLRQRHRFLRKGKYILEAHHQLGCVGCGRCARACVVDITPVNVWNELNRQQEAGSL